MPQAAADPAEMRRFANALKRFTSDLQANLTSIHGQLTGLGDTWRDQEHDKFREEFDQTMHQLARFIAAANEHVPFLMRKADRIEEYLQQR